MPIGRLAAGILIGLCAAFLVLVPTSGAGAEIARGASCGPAFPPPLSGLCDYSPGTDALLIQGTVLAPDDTLVNGELLIGSDGRIACAAFDCSEDPQYPAASTLTCADGVISPGLINALDRYRFEDNEPETQSGVRYDHRHQWRRGQDGLPGISGTSSSEAPILGELRALISGVTSAIGAGNEPGLVRNLGRPGDLGGVAPPAVDISTFPLGDVSGVRLYEGCAYPDFDNRNFDEPFQMKAAEGVEATAVNEFDCLSDDGALGGVNYLPDAGITGGIPLRGDDVAEILAADGSLVWTPRHDLSLYGTTAPVTVAANLGVDVALGTEWVVTGSFDLLSELSCAADFNTNYLDARFSDTELVAMITSNQPRASRPHGRRYRSPRGRHLG